METKKTLTQKYLVLVPHRDIRVEVQKNRDSALKAHVTGVYAFPRVTPLAYLSQALEDSELKQIARSLRTHIGKNKISAQEDTVTDFPCWGKNVYICGPQLDINIPQVFFKNVKEKIKYIFSSFVIGCFLKSEDNTSEDNTKIDILCETPQKKLEFRAAAVANMYWRSLKINGETYYKWKIGKLFWLPRPVSRADKALK